MPKEDIEGKIKRVMPVKVEDLESFGEKVLEVPIYTLDSVPELHCARYTRFAAKHIFGLEYPRQDAWNLAELVGTIEVEDNAEVEELETAGVLTPGMLVGIYLDESQSNLDTRAYTHIALYLGRSASGRGEMLFAEQRIKVTQIQPISGYNAEGAQLKEILFLNEG